MQILTFQTANHLRQLVGDQNQTGLVTFIECRFQPELVGFIQIAATRNFLSQVAVLVESNPFPMYLHGYIPTGDSEKLAKEIRELMGAYQLRGTWFRPQQELIEFIGKNARRPTAVGLPTGGGNVDSKEEQLLTVEQIAEKLQVSEPTIRRLVASGKIPHIRQGRLLRFQMSAVLAALTDKRPTPPSTG